MDTYDKEYQEAARKLAKEIAATDQAFTTIDEIRVYKGTNGRTDWRVSFQDKMGNTFEVNRDWKGYVHVNLVPHKYYKYVSNEAQHQAAKNIYTSQKMKAITLRKLAEKMEEARAFRQVCEDLNAKAADIRTEFLAKFKGMDVQYRYDTDEPKNIIGGTIIRGGLSYEFSIHKDGYISEHINVHYDVDKNLDTFMKMSANKLK